MTVALWKDRLALNLILELLLAWLNPAWSQYALSIILLSCLSTLWPHLSCTRRTTCILLLSIWSKHLKTIWIVGHRSLYYATRLINSPWLVLYTVGDRVLLVVYDALLVIWLCYVLDNFFALHINSLLVFPVIVLIIVISLRILLIHVIFLFFILFLVVDIFFVLNVLVFFHI